MTMNTDIAAAVAAMRLGGVILYPTDTVWGIGCDASNPEAVARVYAIKHRADSKALITLVDSWKMLRRLVGEVPQQAREMMESPRPTTVIFPSARGVAPGLLAPDGSIGVRLTREEFSATLCRELGGPVVSTSANLSGEPSPRFFHEISPDIINAVDYVALTRRADLTPSQPSMVVALCPDGSINILRP